jgi:hypothetical protein
VRASPPGCVTAGRGWNPRLLVPLHLLIASLLAIGSLLIAHCSLQRQRSQLSNFNQRLAPLGMPFGVHIDLITSMANLEGFFVPQVPPAPRCTPVVISTKLTSRLSLAPCCACQPSFGHIQAAPRRALAPVESIRRRSSQAKITDLTTVRTVGLLKQPSRPEACLPRRGPAHASPDLISSPTKSREVT